jgi:PEP-CTERM motif
MKRASLMLVAWALLNGGVGQARADIINWNTWSSSSTGSMTVGSTPVTVTSSNGIMQLMGGNLNLNTLSFSTPLVNPVIAIWSLGAGGIPASFVFGATPVFIAGGPSAEYGGSAIVVSGNTVTGAEGNGTVEFLGTYSSISWTNPLFEDYYGFNVGAPAMAASATPEPSTLTLLGVGAVNLIGYAWRRRKLAAA